MAYEKKIEPASRWDIILIGVTLLSWIIFLQILPWSVGFAGTCATTLFETDIQSSDSLLDFHNCMKTYRSEMLTGTVFLLLGYPIIIAHIYYIQRAMDTIAAFINFGVSGAIYKASWMIVAAVYCTVLPAIVILVAYYDWEFNSDYSYVGYAMQYQLLSFGVILWDTLIIPLGITAATPWFWTVCLILGFFQSAHYKLSQEATTQFLGSWMSCGCCASRVGKFVIVAVCVVMMLIALLGSFLDVFDYEKEGFFSFHGDSQFLFVVLHISWIGFAVCEIIYGCAWDENVRFLDENVKPLSQQ